MKWNPMIKLAIGIAASLAAMQTVHAAPLFEAGIPSGWTCTGNCGTAGVNGDVTLAPGAAAGSQYGWVSTNNGVNSTGLNLGNEQNGSMLRSTTFSATAGQDLEFWFNYITSDGAGYADYAWSRLLDQNLNQVALLFTARTTLQGNSVPGFGMPPIAATINPGQVTIQTNETEWSPLGSNSGGCYNSNGCGQTGWVKSNYSIQDAGNYILEFGVVNWSDTGYQSGLAFDGITVGGVVIGEPSEVPEPTSVALLGLGLAGLRLARRKTA